MMKQRTAIILAAGLGSRLRPFTEKEHKCMTKVCGRPIILNALENLEKSGFDEVIIVVGYLREQLKRQISAFDLDIKITFAENDIYTETNTIFSLKKGMENLSEYDELYVIEGDVFFDISVLKRLTDSRYPNATILEPYNEKLEGTFVETDKNGFVTDWRHKSDQEPGYVLKDKYKTVNLHRFSREFTEQILIPALNETLNADGKKKPIEKAMRVIVSGHPDSIKGEILKGEKWYEIDDVNDLKTAEQIFGGR
jgi:choline kinase